MNLSLGEFEALARKALRGAGYDWGTAEEGARAARTLARFGCDSAALIERLTHWAVDRDLARHRPALDLTPTATPLCPLAAGIALVDLAPPMPVELGTVVEPTLLVPFVQTLLGRSDDPARGARVISGRVTATVHGEALEISTTLVPDVVRIEAVELAPVHQALQSRIDPAPATVAALEAMASRTYAPATEASRSGAGPALSDND